MLKTPTFFDSFSIALA